MRKLLTALAFLALGSPVFGQALKSSTLDLLFVRQRFQLGTDTTKYFTSITESLTAFNTHKQIATAKAVFDGLDTYCVLVTDNAAGDVAGLFSNLQIQANAVGAAEIAADAVGSSEIAADAVGSSEIAANAVGSSEIAADAVGSSEIAGDAVGSSEIEADAVGPSEIQTGAVGSAEIADGNIALVDMGANSVDSNKVVDNGISYLDLSEDEADEGDVLKFYGGRWHPRPDSAGTGGGGGTVTSADNGVSLSATTVQLGNATGGTAAQLTGNREIPLNGKKLSLSGNTGQLIIGDTISKSFYANTGDGFPRLTVSDQSGGTNQHSPLINTVGSKDFTNIFQFNPTAIDTGSAPFNIYYGISRNLQYPNIHDNSYVWGVNMHPNGRFKTTQPALGFQYEDEYEISGFGWCSEFYLTYYTKNNISSRPWALYINREGTGAALQQWYASTYNWRYTDHTDLMDLNPTTGLTAKSQMRVSSPAAGNAVFSFRNAANNNYLTGIKTLSDNSIEWGSLSSVNNMPSSLIMTNSSSSYVGWRTNAGTSANIGIVANAGSGQGSLFANPGGFFWTISSNGTEIFRVKQQSNVNYTNTYGWVNMGTVQGDAPTRFFSAADLQVTKYGTNEGVFAALLGRTYAGLWMKDSSASAGNSIFEILNYQEKFRISKMTEGGGLRTPIITVTHASRVGVNSDTPDASSVLDVASTTGGFLPPRMTTTQRDAISSPATGLEVYNTTIGGKNYYDGTKWIRLSSKQQPSIAAGAAAGTTPTVAMADDANDVGGKIVVTTGTSTTTGTLATITFASSYGTAPAAVILTAANANARAAGTTFGATSISATSFVITFDSAPSASAGYEFYYRICQ